MSRQEVYNNKQWWKARAQTLKRDQYRCTKCGRAGRLEVHHKVRLADGGDNYALWNLKTLCRPCHFEQHKNPGISAWELRIRSIEKQWRHNN